MEDTEENTFQISSLFRDKYKLRLVIITVLTLMILSVFINIWALVFIITFSFLNSLLLSIERYVSITHDLELSTFSAVMMSVSFGLGWGMTAAFFTKFMEIMYNKSMEIEDILAITSFMIAAVLGFIFRDMNITEVGIVVTFAVNVFNFITSSMVGYYTKYELIFQVMTNIVLNLVLFVSAAPVLLTLLTLLR
ncbi:TPA: hypothetical protein HA239_04185 [Candidatus Woesearchaeota archaeon]|nr:hypothetical protein QT06_C0001G0744 [archaeon GW2011_AR15]MBS3103473.1 hypothetical protein [Candidatus Woesearchaeota archaeon]HIH41591.1 hypothetical protein [Candidatus Woesearchaeota archaeon]